MVKKPTINKIMKLQYLDATSSTFFNCHVETSRNALLILKNVRNIWIDVKKLFGKAQPLYFSMWCFVANKSVLGHVFQLKHLGGNAIKNMTTFRIPQLNYWRQVLNTILWLWPSRCRGPNIKSCDFLRVLSIWTAEPGESYFPDLQLTGPQSSSRALAVEHPL